MIAGRIGFLPPSDKGWMGGVNYFVNLFRAVELHSGGRYRCVAFVSPTCPDELKQEYSAFADVVATDVLQRYSPAWILKHLLKTIGLDIWRWVAKRHGISVFSHVFGCMSPGVPVLAWIPDFQHMWLPNMFSAKELHNRNREFSAMIRKCSAVILSSESARQDCIRFAGKDMGKFYVMHFVVQRQAALPAAEFRTETRKKFGLPARFFHMPNQFWAHKNHRVVFEAVASLRRKGIDVCVVCTGNVEDSRNPGHVESLKNFIRENDLESSILSLGLIGYKEMLAIMGESLAVINPSRFEGWSTPVEECKSLALPIILSSIPVHVEQAPPGGMYFDPDDHEGLAAILSKVWSEGVAKLPENQAMPADQAYRGFYGRFAEILELTTASRHSN